MNWFKKKKKEPYCKCEDYSPCNADKDPRCEMCGFYRIIDSGYGYCIALPTVVTVPWCRITCSLFELK